MLEFLKLGVALQVSLGAGYLAYCIAYAGYRNHHPTKDTIFIVAVFSAIGSSVFANVQQFPTLIAFTISVCATLLSAIFWRKLGARYWQKVMMFFQIHREDGVQSTWENLVQTKHSVDQVSVQLNDGRVLYLNDRRPFVGKTPWDGLYLGSDGAIIMIVEEEEIPDGTCETRQGICVDMGTRMTYIPPNQISRVNIRLG